MEFSNPDLHMHSSYSDGSDTPEELLQKVRAAGIDIFALTDHDTYRGCDAMRRCLKEGDPYFIGGVELSCKDDLGKYHILGYCYDVNKPSIREAVELTHSVRMEKAMGRFRYLEETLGYTFTPEEKESVLSQKNPGKPHFAALMAQKGYVATTAEAFHILAGYKGNNRVLTPFEAVDAILSADGIPVLAHGILADGSKKLTEQQITERVSRLKQVGLMGLECYYSGYTQEEQEIMLSLAQQFNLLVTAGSDYHGTRKMVQLGQTNHPDPQKMKRFYTTVQFLLQK